MTVATLARPLAVNDRFELTDVARPKLRPHGSRGGLILGDCGDSWRVVFDGTTPPRTILKAFIQAGRP